jgi:hypothetical protein
MKYKENFSLYFSGRMHRSLTTKVLSLAEYGFNHKKFVCPICSMGVPGGGGGSPPSLLGKQSQSGNIRFIVGQYWLIIKINRTNSANFVGNMLSNRNFS